MILLLLLYLHALLWTHQFVKALVYQKPLLNLYKYCRPGGLDEAFAIIIHHVINN